MVYRRARQKVRRVYSHSKSIFNGDLLKNPYIVGIAAGVIKNALAGKKIIDIENIKTRVSKMDGSNPAIFLGLGILTHNPALTAIGAYAVIDPPDEKKEELCMYSNIGENGESVGCLNVGENEESAGYSNVGEIQKTEKKRCVY